MLQVVLMEEGVLLNDEVSEMHQKLQIELKKVNDALKLLNSKWDQVGETSEGREDILPLSELDSISQRLSFWVKWSSQLGERSGRLMF